MCDPAFRRAEHVKTKSGAVWVTFLEMRDFIKSSGIAEHYFERSPAWLTQRINNNLVFGKPATFTEAEYAKLAESLRHIARRLRAHADEIDAAALDCDD